MKGIFLTEEGKQEIETKIAEIEKQMDKNREFASVFYALSGRNLMLKEILSSATILPVEKSWENVNDMLSINTLPISYKQGVIIQPKS
jgi:hypothetical protein